MLRRILGNGIKIPPSIFHNLPNQTHLIQTVLLSKQLFSTSAGLENTVKVLPKTANNQKNYRLSADLPKHSIPTYLISRFFSTSDSSKTLKIDITGIDKATLLAGLYNNSKPLGLGFCDPKSMKEMSYEEAEQWIKSGRSYFDYLNGRLMKVNLKGNELFTGYYDRDNGQGAALAVVTACRNGTKVESKLPIPSNKIETLAAEGKIEEAVTEASKYISTTYLR